MLWKRTKLVTFRHSLTATATNQESRFCAVPRAGTLAVFQRPTMHHNQAAYLISKSGEPLQVKTSPYTQPAINEIVVKNAAIAINPVDWMKQAVGNMMFSWIKYPFIMGSDLAGEVVEVGHGVTRFEVGDRVLGHGVGMDQRSNKSSEGAFQQYTVIRADLASQIPQSLTYEEACVLPLGLSTAACGLFMKDYLALPYPTLSPIPTGKTLLVWGGSTSVGSNAIQLGVAAGYEVITTCSQKNFDYVRKLGVSEVFDYKSPTVVKDITAAFRNRESGGAFAIGSGSLTACVEILGNCKGSKSVADASADFSGEFPSSVLGWIFAGASMAIGKLSMVVKSTIKGVDTKFIWGSDLMANEVGKVIYKDFLPAALAKGKYIAAPEPLVVGKGLDSVQEAMNLNRRGVSAKKVVVSL